MEVNLDIVVQMASYDPFHTKVCKQGRWRGQVHTLPLLYSREINLRVKIVEHAFEEL
jgi:hypothetical protein